MSDAILLPPVGSTARPSAPVPAPARPLPASPVKIWGARVRGAASPGDLITVSTSTGKEWTARVVAVLSTSGGSTLVYAEGTDPKPARDKPARRGGRNRNRFTRCEDAPCCGCCE